MSKAQALADIFQVTCFKWAETVHEFVALMEARYPENREYYIRIGSRIEEAIDRMIEQYQIGEHDMAEVEKIHKEIMSLRAIIER